MEKNVKRGQFLVNSKDTMHAWTDVIGTNQVAPFKETCDERQPAFISEGLFISNVCSNLYIHYFEFDT